MGHRTYLSTAMSGQPDSNFPLFFSTADRLRASGYQVENPAENDGPTLEEAVANANKHEYGWSYYMKRDVKRLAECDSICLLPGWQGSRGARVEYQLAKDLEMPIYREVDGKLVPRIEAIGISGYARAGKDSAAQPLLQSGWLQGSFASKIKEALYLLNPIGEVDWTVTETSPSVQQVVDAVGWERAKDAFPLIRPLLQRMGTDVGRTLFGDNVWVDLALDAIPDGSQVVFTDVRFPNEADAVRNIGGRVWRVNRPGTGPANAHASETALDDYRFDVVLDNDGSLEDLATRVKEVLG